MSGLGGTIYRPNICYCGHDNAVHTPNCSQCTLLPHPFSADPPTIAVSNTGGGANANGQRGG